MTGTNSRIEVGHPGTREWTVLRVHHLHLPILRGVVYGQAHRMETKGNTAAKRDELIRAVEKTRTLDPVYVVPAHCLEAMIHGKWHLGNVRRYLFRISERFGGRPNRFRMSWLRRRPVPYRFNTGAGIWPPGTLTEAKVSRIPYCPVVGYWNNWNSARVLTFTSITQNGSPRRRRSVGSPEYALNIKPY